MKNHYCVCLSNLNDEIFLSFQILKEIIMSYSCHYTRRYEVSYQIISSQKYRCRPKFQNPIQWASPTTQGWLVQRLFNTLLLLIARELGKIVPFYLLRQKFYNVALFDKSWYFFEKYLFLSWFFPDKIWWIHQAGKKGACQKSKKLMVVPLFRHLHRSMCVWS